MPPRITPVRGWRAAATSLAAVVALTPLAGCGGGHKKQAASNASSTQKISVPGADVTFKAVAYPVQSAGPIVLLDAKTKSAVMTQTRQYVEDAIVGPLLSGKKAPSSYTALFAPAVLAAATAGADRHALTDEGVGKVSGSVKAPTTTVALTGLADGTGSLLFVGANFTLKLTTKVGGTPLAITHKVELTYEKTPSGKWVVSAYRAITTRLTPTASKTSTASTTRKP